MTRKLYNDEIFGCSSSYTSYTQARRIAIRTLRGRGVFLNLAFPYLSPYFCSFFFFLFFFLYFSFFISLFFFILFFFFFSIR
jgi:hypothetical protein